MSIIKNNENARNSNNKARPAIRGGGAMERGQREIKAQKC